MKKSWVMSVSGNKGLLTLIFDGLPLFVAVGLGVSACAFAAVMVVTSLKGDVTYALVDKEGAAVVNGAEVGEDSILTIPGSVGLPWDEHTVRKIENHAFENDERFSSVSLPEGLRVIGYSSFYGCKKLRSLEIPASVEEIDDGAFYGCTALKEVRLSPNMSTAGEYIFERCASLERVDIPEGVKALPRSIFCACSSLTEIKLPSSLISIDPLAFKDCTSLTEIVIPEGVRDIGGCSFEMCTSLRRAVIPPHVNGLGVTAFNGCSALAEVVCLSPTPPPLGSSVFDGISEDAILYVRKSCSDEYEASEWGKFFKEIRELTD